LLGMAGSAGVADQKVAKLVIDSARTTAVATAQTNGKKS